MAYKLSGGFGRGVTLGVLLLLTMSICSCAALDSLLKSPEQDIFASGESATERRIPLPPTVKEFESTAPEVFAPLDENQ